MPVTLTGILILMMSLYAALAFAARWIPASRWMMVPLVAVALLSSINGLYYMHCCDSIAVHYQYRTWAMSDYVPALSGLCVGALIMRTSGMAWLIAKTIAVCMSLVVMALPWAKPLINPLAEFATQNVVTNGVIHQTSPSTCGPCAMAFTLSLLGCTASEGVLADESFTSGSGTELWFLARCAERRGFRVTYSASTSVLSADSIIGIRLGDTGHSVSVYGVSDDYVAIHDSMQGRTMIPRTTLLTTYRYSGLSLHVAARPQPDR